MGQNWERMIPATIAIVCATFLPSPPATAQAVSLQEQLAAQYKLVKMGSDTSGYSVVEKGTLLEIKKGGILGVPYSDQSVLSTKYEDGTVHSPNNLLTKGTGAFMKRFGKEQTTHLMQVGDKVYPSKIDVNVAQDKVTLSIVECDTCNKTDPPTYNKANVVFQFPKGSLAKAGAGDVEDTIGQLLSISDDSQQAQGDQQQGQDPGQGQNQDQGQAQTQAQAQPQPQAQAEPQTVEKGMTPDQVTSALGKPTSIVTVGQKQIYVYKDMNMKITFLNGKVSDVQ
jgi:hypothetical protein